MRRSIAIAILGAGLILAAMIRADAEPAERPRIGVLDLERARIDTAAGKRASAQFKRVLKSKQAALDVKQKELPAPRTVPSSSMSSTLAFASGGAATQKGAV